MTVVVAFAAAAVWAKTTTWQGPSGGNWNAESNWNGGVPAAGDTVVLTDSSVNDLEGLSLVAIEFAGSGAYTLSGNAVTVTSGITVSSACSSTVALPITAGGAQTVNVISGATLTFEEAYAYGANTLTFTAPSTTAPGTIRFETAATGTGAVNIKQGLVYAACDNALGSGAITINTLVSSKYLYGRLILAGATIPNALSISDSNNRGGEPGLSCAANTTNALLGKLTYDTSSCYPIIPLSSELIVAGGFQMVNWFRAGAGSNGNQGGYFTVSNIAATITGLGYTDQPEPSVRLKVAGNKIGVNLINLVSNKRRLSLEVDEAFALDTTATIKGAFQGTVYLNGTTQHMHGFSSLTKATGGVFTTEDEATLYMVQKAEMGTVAYGGQINGPLNFSKSGTYKLTLGGISGSPRTFASTGYLEVTEGDLELNKFATWSSGDVRVSGSGNLILNDIANLPNTSVITVTTNETSTAKITLNGTVQVAKLVINGEQLDEDTYTREKLGELIAGDGAVVVSDPSRQPKTTTWTGAAGGVWSNRDNWDNGKPLAGDSVVLTASSVNDIPNLLLGGLTYGGKGGYATTGQGVMLNGPLSTITEPDGDVGLVRVFTNDLSITISGTQTWTIESTNTTLVCTQPITSQTLLTCTGYGTLELRADNALTGGFFTKQTCVHAYRDASFSASGDGSVGIERISKSTRGRLWLHGVTIKNDISENEGNDYRHGLVSAAGTTNVLKGLFKTNASVYPGVQKDSTLIFDGGVYSENKNLFRPCGGFQGGQKESGSNDPTSWVIIRNKPITNCQGLSYDESCSIRFEVAGNDFTKNPQDAKQKYSGVTIFGSRTRVETAVPYAFDFADGNGPIRRLEGTLDLCGNDQRVGGFTYLDCNNGQITSDEPATLYLVQKLLQSNGSSTPKALQQNIAGQVSISKAGTNTTYLAKAKTSTGRLEVTEGDLNLAADFSWAGTNIVVSGTNTVASMGDVVKPGNLVINGKGNLNRDSVLKVYGDGTVTFGSSVLVTVAELWKTDEDGVPVRMEPGNYTKANCSFVKGDGILHVRGGGLVIFMR